MANVGRPLDIDDFVDIAADTGLALSASTSYTLQNKSDFRLWLMEYAGGGTPLKNSAATVQDRIFVEGSGQRCCQLCNRE